MISDSLRDEPKFLVPPSQPSCIMSAASAISGQLSSRV
jgi:hypothetical protein